MDIITIKEKIGKLSSQHDAALSVVEDEQKSLALAELWRDNATEAQVIIQSLAKEVQQKAHDSIASVVTHCLKSVFGDEAYEFKLIFEEKRGRTECRPVFLRDGNEIHPMRGSGGGAVDLCAFALRLVCLILSRPAHRRFLVLDEPWKFLSVDYIDKARELMERLADEMGVQFLVVTHNEGLMAGKVITLPQ